jgi:hypothetical protein
MSEVSVSVSISRGNFSYVRALSVVCGLGWNVPVPPVEQALANRKTHLRQYVYPATKDK